MKRSTVVSLEEAISIASSPENATTKALQDAHDKLHNEVKRNDLLVVKVEDVEVRLKNLKCVCKSALDLRRTRREIAAQAAQVEKEAA